MEVGGFFRAGFFLKAAASPVFRIGLNDFGKDLSGPDGEVFGKSVIADAAGAFRFLRRRCLGLTPPVRPCRRRSRDFPILEP